MARVIAGVMGVMLSLEQIGAISIISGILIGLIAVPWLLMATVRARMGATSWKSVQRAAFFLGVAFLLATVPILVNSVWSRVAGFGPLEQMVNGERQITLTGWDRKDYSPLRQKLDLTVLQMANADVNDETLGLLNGMDKLRELDVSDSSITDVGLSVIAQLPKLESLRLRNTKITDAGFRQHLFDKKTIKNLDLIGTEVASKTVREWKKEDSNRKALK